MEFRTQGRGADIPFDRQPVWIDGFAAFAPTLAHDNDGFDGASHATLDALQGDSFWFRERNRLIAAFARRYGPAEGVGLELGCGSGYVLDALRAALPGVRFVGGEIHVSGLRAARARHGDAVFLAQMDARDLPLRDALSVAAAFDVLEHVDDDERALAELFAALRPGGLLMLSVPQHPWLWSRADDIGRHKRRYRRPELARKVRAAGFDILRDTSFVTLLLPAMAAQRLGAGRRADYDGAAELRLPRIVDAAFGALLAAERAWIGLGLSLPLGGSRFVIARKPAGRAA